MGIFTRGKAKADGAAGGAGPDEANRASRSAEVARETRRSHYAIESWFFGPSAFPEDYIPVAL